MITTIISFIAGAITGVLVTLNNTRKLRNAVTTLETEAQELREKVEAKVSQTKNRITKKR
jgi:uncharacterized membrane protein YebE (DUF533 family)